MKKCMLCPRGCKVDRSVHAGFCGGKTNAKVCKADLFFYEEPIISGTRGSGAVFFSGCSLKCVFCQNYEISSNPEMGKSVSAKQLSDIFRTLEERGAHNINLVNPTHYSSQIIEAFKIYKPKIPVVYNTHGYESVEILKEINEYVDIYLTDLKYMSSFASKKYSNCPDYFDKASKAIEFMCNNKKQMFGEDSMLKSGVIIRHLILPLCSDDSINLLHYIKDNLPSDVIISVMSQYTPIARLADVAPEINRRNTKRELSRVEDCMIELGLNGYVQDFNSASTKYIPHWDY